MTDPMETILKRLIAQHGISVAHNANRCEGLLRDTCPDRNREIFILTNAVRQHIPEDLRAPRHSLPLSLMKGFLAKRLCDELGFSDAAARWAVNCWAAALDLDAMNDTSGTKSHLSPITRSTRNQLERPGDAFSPEICKQWADDLATGTPTARQDALTNLALHPDKECIELLIGALANDQPDVRCTAFDILTNPAIRAESPLIDALATENQHIVWRAALVLGALRAECSSRYADRFALPKWHGS